jgi:hypothetical protein
MARPVNRKCKHCATLPPEEAIALHGDEGDGCWNPRDIKQQGYDCHRRRHHYRHRVQVNAERKRSRRRAYLSPSSASHDPAVSSILTLTPPVVPYSYAAILVLYRQTVDAPVHAVAAEVWFGDRQVAGIPAIHCMGMRGDEVSTYIRQMLTLLQEQFGIHRFEDVVKECPVHTCPVRPCPYTQDV